MLNFEKLADGAWSLFKTGAFNGLAIRVGFRLVIGTARWKRGYFQFTRRRPNLHLYGTGQSPNNNRTSMGRKQPKLS